MSPLCIQIHGGHVLVDLIDADLMTDPWYIGQRGHAKRSGAGRTSHCLMRTVAERILGRPMPPGHYAKALNGNVADCTRSNIGICLGPRGRARPIDEFIAQEETE